MRTGSLLAKSRAFFARDLHRVSGEGLGYFLGETAFGL